MKLTDIDKVNGLVSQLGELRELVRAAEHAEPAMFQLLIETGGDSSLRMSAEGTATTHANGVVASAEFLARLKELAIADLHAKRDGVLVELKKLGVDTDAG
jgi:hypothetical protein